MSIQTDGDANITPAARAAAANMRGGIPSANPIDTPTVNATLAPRMRVIENILTNDSAPKRTHNTVPPVDANHPFKVQRVNPQASLSSSNNVAPTPETFSRMTLHQQQAFHRMSAYGTSGYKADSYTEQMMDLSNPFAPLPRDVAGYNVTRDDNSSSDNKIASTQ